MYESAEAAHRNQEPKVIWVLSCNHPDRSQCQSFLISAQQIPPLAFIEAARFLYLLGSERNKTEKRSSPDICTEILVPLLMAAQLEVEKVLLRPSRSLLFLLILEFILGCGKHG